jgi:hypothetical protein
MRPLFLPGIKSQRGIALVTILVIVVGISGLVMALLLLAQMRVADVLSELQRIETFYLAQTGLSDAIWYFNAINEKFYSEGATAYKLLTTDASGINKNVGEYSVFTGGLMISNNDNFNTDLRQFLGAGEKISFLIWDGEENKTNANATIKLDCGGITDTLTVGPGANYDLNNDAINEGFVYKNYKINTSPLPRPGMWHVVMTLADSSFTYEVNDITLDVGGVGSPTSPTGIRRVKSGGYFPSKTGNYRLKTVLAASGQIVSGSGLNYKFKELKE